MTEQTPEFNYDKFTTTEKPEMYGSIEELRAANAERDAKIEDQLAAARAARQG